MFSATNQFAATKEMFLQNTSPECIERLDKVLTDYQKLADSDPNKLRMLIPAAEIWRLFVDGDNYENGWLGFEDREPGYLKAMYRAFHEIFNGSHKLSVDFIKQLHTLATKNVKFTNYEFSPGEIGRFRGSDYLSGGYYLGKKAITKNGIYELLERNNAYNAFSIGFPILETTTFDDFVIDNQCVKKIRELGDIVNIENIKSRNKKILWALCESFDRNVFFHFYHRYSRDKSQKTIEKFIELILAIYKTSNKRELAKCLYKFIRSRNKYFRYLLISHQSNCPEEALAIMLYCHIKRYQKFMRLVAESKIEKLLVIINFIRSCEQLHPFKDANCRTFCMLMLIYLLKRNGFPLAIQVDPNRFDLHSLKELLNEVITGMENTFTLVKKKILFDVRTNDIYNYFLENKLTIEEEYFKEITALEEDHRERITESSRNKRRHAI